MSELNQAGSFELLADKPKLPTPINVLTILTFVGCGLGFCWTFGGFAFMSWSLKMMDKAQSQNSNLTDKQMADMDKSRGLIEIMIANKWPLILISLVGIILCLYGAIMMRKLKKEGYYIYLVGEIVPVIGSILVLGYSTYFNGVGSYIFGLGLPLVFIILYTVNLKYLK